MASNDVYGQSTAHAFEETAEALGIGASVRYCSVVGLADHDCDLVYSLATPFPFSPTLIHACRPRLCLHAGVLTTRYFPSGTTELELTLSPLLELNVRIILLNCILGK